MIYLIEESFVSTYEELASKAEKSVANVRRYLSPYVYTSLNKNRKYVASKRLIKMKSDRHGFFKDENTGAIFHIKGDIRSVIQYLAKKIDWGITEHEVNELSERPCYRPINELLKSGKLVAAKVNGLYVYFHPKRYKIQFRNRCSNKRVSPSLQGSSKEPPILPLENILETLGRQQELERETLEKFSVILLQYYEQETYRGFEARLLLDERLREMLGFSLSEVPDHTTLWRIFDSLTTDQVNDLFRVLLKKLVDKKVIKGRYLVVDATHIFAWANTRKTINDHEVMGAAWGEHHGSFYGYKVHILVDPEVDLPVSIKLTHGNASDCDYVIPLLDDVDSTIGLDDVIAIFGDAAYYGQPLFNSVRKKYDLTINSHINPRRSKPLKCIKQWVKDVFNKYGDKIETVSDAMALLPQKLLTDFGADLGSTKDNMIKSAIRERLNRKLRSSVERVFSRAKNFFWLERPRTREIGRVLKHVIMGFNAMLLVALTSKDLGWEDNTLALSRVY